MRIIHDDPPMRDEIASGFYPRFEGGWHRAEVWGRAAMLAFVGVCGLGLFGHGPLGEGHAANRDGTISVLERE